MKHLIFIVVSLAMTSGIGNVVLAQTPVAERSAEQNDPNHIKLKDHEGRPVSVADFKGRTVLLNFIFTHCPDACPTQVSDLVYIQKHLPAELRGQIQFLSVSIDPERDSPEKMKKFALAMGASLDNWSFLTGSPKDIEALSRRHGAQSFRNASGELDHRLGVYLYAADGRMLQRYGGASLDRPRLLREIATVHELFNKTQINK